MNPTILARLFQAQTDSIQAAQRATSPMPGGDDVALWSQPGQSPDGDTMEGAIDPSEMGTPPIQQEPGNLWPQDQPPQPIAAPPGAPPSDPPLGGMFGPPPASQRMATRRPG